MGLVVLARADHNNRQTTYLDAGRVVQSPSVRATFPNEEGNLVDPLRILTHPGFPAVVGEGIYVYPYNPHRTRNFILAPARKMDTNVVRTIGSNVALQRSQVDEDIVITEVWDSSISPISTLAEMARVFQEFYTKTLGVGELLGWQPRDLSQDRFLVRIVNLQIGGVDYEYREIPDATNGAWIESTLTLTMKLEKASSPARGAITLEGI